MHALSIVLIVKNEERNIRACLVALQGLSNDILVADTGSTDNTIAISTSLGAKVIQLPWQGYGDTKNEANKQAKHNWILSVDADEVMNEALKHEISLLSFDNVHTAYLIQRKMMYCGKLLHYGSSSSEYRLRLFNKMEAQWNTNNVHEELILNDTSNTKKLSGFLVHHSYQSIEEHRERLWHYAKLHAAQIKASDKKVGWIKKIISPTFSFIKNYIFKLGFLDGMLGYQYAVNEKQYVKWKYQT